MSLSIAINGRFRHRRITGVERYAHEVSKRLQTRKRFVSPRKPLGQFSGHLWEQFILPHLVFKDEVLWSPANTSAWGVTKQAVTLHDASVFDHPEWFRSSYAAWTRLSWKILAKRAKAIITDAALSRNRLKLHLGIPGEKLHVIHLGVGDPFLPQSRRSIEAVQEKYGLRKPYFLFVGTIEPRKNLKAVLQAWELADLNGHELFIAGVESAGHIFNATNHNHSIRHTGSRYAARTASLPDHQRVTYVPDQDLPALYSGAAALVSPSLYEGFGLPILEAMACGAPVIASDIPIFHEIFEGAVLFVNPQKPNEIAETMQRIIEDRQLAATMREQGLKTAEELTWDKTAANTLAVLERMA